MLGRLISSQNRTSHLFICMGDSTTPLGVRLYSQYWSNVFSSSSGVVALEKFRPTTCQGENIIIQNIQITVESKNMYLKIHDNNHSYTTSQNGLHVLYNKKNDNSLCIFLKKPVSKYLSIFIPHPKNALSYT